MQAAADEVNEQFLLHCMSPVLAHRERYAFILRKITAALVKSAALARSLDEFLVIGSAIAGGAKIRD
jgi:hypothetical protein